jgi:hypothetical protein
MKTLLTIVFCKIYGLIKEDFNAMGFVTILVSINVLSVIGYYKVLIMHDPNFLIPRIYEIAICVGIGVMNFLFFLKDNKYVTIYQEFTDNPRLSGRRGSWITAAYVVGTLAFSAGLIWV